MSASFRRPELSRVAVSLMVSGVIFLVAGWALGYLVADHSSSDSSASSQISIGLAATGTLVIAVGAVLLGCAAAARRWRPAGPGHSPGDRTRTRPRSSRAVRAGVGLMVSGICCLVAGTLIGVLLAAVSVSGPVGNLVLSVLGLGGPLALVSGAVLLAGVALVRLWHRITAR
jgi:hypothetical protein